MICKECNNCGLCEGNGKFDKNIPVEISHKLPDLIHGIDCFRKNDVGIAVDIGTTTIAMCCYSLNDAELIESCGEVNNQRKFGSNVLSRIDYASDSYRAAELHKTVVAQIKQMIQKLLMSSALAIGSNRINLKKIVVTGNTTMLSFLMNYETAGMKQFPFHPYSLFGINIDFDDVEDVYVCPACSAFIGADIVCSAVSCNLGELLFADGKSKLIADIGTNCEMCYWSSLQGKLYATSSAAGPAFESKGLMGTQIISKVADMIKLNLVDKNGMICGAKSICHGQDSLSQNQIRDLQLAKSAVATGLQFLLDNSQGEGVDCLCLAGGFGTKLDIEDSVLIRMIPSGIKSYAVGNAALQGAVMMMFDDSLRRKAEKLAGEIEVIDLANKQDFQNRYISNLSF